MNEEALKRIEEEKKKRTGRLNLSNCGLKEIPKEIANMTWLTTLNLYANYISKIEGLDNLIGLKSLSLSWNFISKIEGLDNLVRLNSLNLSKNQLAKIEDIIELKNLRSKPNLRIEKNEITKDLQLSDELKVSHLPAVLNLIDRYLESNKIKITLPLKVLLLGNHSSGKSTLLHYLLSNEIKAQDSTHILNIEYLKNSDTETSLPKAVFFDFGGQDYYHGMYKTFLSQDALYLILWKHSTNHNERILSDANGITCHHFSLPYWLAQKKYLETEIYSYKENTIIDPKFVIQTHYGEEKGTEQSMGLPDEEKLRFSLIPGNEEKYQYDRQDILSKIDALLEDEKYKRDEPKWYVDFLNYLISEGKSNNRFRDTIELLLDPPIYDTKLDNIGESLIAELMLLHRRGLVLYYPNIDQTKYWPGPASFAKYVHDHILTKVNFLFKYKGVIPLDKFKVNDSKVDETIKKVLIEQKIIFQDDYKNNIIVPGFLSLTSDDDVKKKYKKDIENVNIPMFYLHFTQYLPFGYINQLISSIGQQGKHLCYWRDEVYFLFEKIEFRINFDYKHLRISVFSQSEPKIELKRYLFYTLIAEYWGLEMPCFSLYSEIERNLVDLKISETGHYGWLITKTECRPKDLYISLDGNVYVEYQSIWTCTSDAIPCFPITENVIDLNQKSKTCKLAPFKKLIKNKYMPEEKRKLKAFISYSKYDGEECNDRTKGDGVNYLEKFKEVLSGLTVHKEILDAWEDTNLIPGEDWDKRIEDELNSADIIFLLVSSSFANTKYIKDKELKIAFERQNKKECIVIPIIVRDYSGWVDIKWIPENSALPKKARSIDTWSKDNKFASVSQVWSEVYDGIKKAIDNYKIYP
ncbi:MAG: TIR domain-containing protein [Saprospiraceae bacterium]|nr:TIR domain-containing protein [Saprospiraceae bacterium]